MFISCLIYSVLLLNYASGILTEPKGQLLSITGKTEDEVFRSLERVLLTMRITSSEPKVIVEHDYTVLHEGFSWLSQFVIWMSHSG